MRHLRHADADLRGYKNLHRVVGRRAAQRIATSYDHIDRVMSRFEPTDWRSAYDVGCGASFDTWALAGLFDRVIAIDTDPRQVLRAKLLARRLGVDRVRFQRRDGTRWLPPQQFDFVYSNLVSHNAVSRVGFISRLANATATKSGCLYIAEICEGYAPLELHAAIEGRDWLAAEDRLRQALAGLLGTGGFRFFFSGTAEKIVESFGLKVENRESDQWNGLATVERLWCRRINGDSEAPIQTGDYMGLTGHAESLRRELNLIVSRNSDGDMADAAVAFATSSGNPLAPLALVLAMAEIACARLLAPQSVPERAWRRVRGRVRPPSIDWNAMHELDDLLIELLARGSESR